VCGGSQYVIAGGAAAAQLGGGANGKATAQQVERRRLHFKAQFEALRAKLGPSCKGGVGSGTAEHELAGATGVDKGAAAGRTPWQQNHRGSRGQVAPWAQ